jgi:hypothetical protein
MPETLLLVGSDGLRGCRSKRSGMYRQMKSASGTSSARYGLAAGARIKVGDAHRSTCGRQPRRRQQPTGRTEHSDGTKRALALPALFDRPTPAP